ncbi:conserved hypothetical protein [Candidatus Nitrosotenuis uzonensis]|uniref:Roadblock/LAMTOR2 domain-containing protein n=1 Tax=Candidatus Nitrosotenuis uzonensis TaxID=1407055 RepID=A0A812F2M6_9ARCH|nr:conserved hypothetical protein [Candidatus Nitrosotenuis uzonensis]
MQITYLLSGTLQKQFFEEKCSLLLEQDEIRFAGIINEDGKLVSGGFKKDIRPLEEDESRLNSFMEFASMISLRKEFDKTLGPINYLAARRDKIVLISFPFPVSKFILLISAEPTVDIESLATKVVSAFSSVS